MLKIIASSGENTDHEKLPMQACSKFNACSVNICPLDPDYRLRTHLSGEPSCHYLRLHVKKAATPDEEATAAYVAAVRMWENKEELPGALVSKLNHAALTGRRLGGFKKVD